MTEGLKVAKLVSGEFIIGRIYDQYLINIFLISFNVDQRSGVVSTSLIPYMAPFDNGLKFMMPFEKIMAISDAPSNLINQYITSATSLINSQKEGENKDGTSGSDRTTETTNGSDGISVEQNKTETENS